MQRHPHTLDEPEAALSPQRQLAFLRILHQLDTPRQAQFLIATHSPIILSYPGARIYSLDGDSIRQVECHETEHFRVTRDFLNAPERYLKRLFEDTEKADACYRRSASACSEVSSRRSQLPRPLRQASKFLAMRAVFTDSVWSGVRRDGLQAE